MRAQSTCLCIGGGSKNARMGQIGERERAVAELQILPIPAENSMWDLMALSPGEIFCAKCYVKYAGYSKDRCCMPAKQKRYKTSHYLALDIHYKAVARLGSAIPCTAESAQAVVEQVFSGPLVRNLGMVLLQ